MRRVVPRRFVVSPMTWKLSNAVQTTDVENIFTGFAVDNLFVQLKVHRLSYLSVHV